MAMRWTWAPERQFFQIKFIFSNLIPLVDEGGGNCRMNGWWLILNFFNSTTGSKPPKKNSNSFKIKPLPNNNGNKLTFPFLFYFLRDCQLLYPVLLPLMLLVLLYFFFNIYLVTLLASSSLYSFLLVFILFSFFLWIFIYFLPASVLPIWCLLIGCLVVMSSLYGIYQWMQQKEYVEYSMEL